jgi:crotonobetaine/carnitine-CoA ligase
VKDVSGLLDQLARTRAIHPALHWVPFDGPGETWTYGRLVDDILRVAAGLQRRGVSPGDRVVILSDNSPDVVRAWAAITTIGAVAVSLNARSTIDELRFYGGHAAPVGAIVQPARADDLGRAMPDLRWITDSVDGLLAHDSDIRRPAIEPSWPASVQYTSGTTSRPKAVLWTHANCLWAGRVGAAHQALRPDDVNLIHLPLFHTNALSYSLLSTWHAGGTVVLQPRFSASRFWDVSTRYRCTWSAMVTFCVRALEAHDAPARHSYRGMGHSRCTPVGEGPGGVGTIGWYGMTETVSHPIVGTMTDRPGSMGRPAPEYGVLVLDDAGLPVPPGETGALLVRGVPGLSMFAGYLGDDAATTAAYTDDGWFRTGDRVRLDEEGTITFVERDKDVLKVGGENVGAPEIERVLLSVPGVLDAAVVGRPDPMLGDVPVAFVVTDGSVVLAAIEAACAAQLPPFKRAREIRVVDDLPTATLGKVAKAQLRDWARESTPPAPS